MSLDAHTIALRFLQKLPDAMLDFNMLGEALGTLKSDLSVPHLLIAQRDHRSILQIQDTMLHPYLVNGYGDESHIDSYLDFYRQHDDWDQFELRCDLTQARATTQYDYGRVHPKSLFNEWLTPLDITENATIKLYDHAEGWLGMNIHFDSRYADTGMVLEVMNLIRPALARTLFGNIYGLSRGRLGYEETPTLHPELIMRSDHRLMRSNPAAERFLEQSQDICLFQGKVLFCDSRTHRAFTDAVARLLQYRQARILPLPSHLHVGTHVFLSLDERLANNAIEVETLVRMTIVSESKPNPVVDHLAQIHGLNPTQTQILRCNAQGMTAKQAATIAHCSEEHARAILSGLYRLLGVKNQIGLLALLSEYARVMDK